MEVDETLSDGSGLLAGDHNYINVKDEESMRAVDERGDRRRNAEPTENKINEGCIKHCCDNESFNIKTNKARLLNWTKCDKSTVRQSEAVNVDAEPMFDKIPSYLTVLSLPNKMYSKGDSSQLLVSDDHLPQRDPSPDRDHSQFNKIPAYHNCFTNSTKYDLSQDSDSSDASDRSSRASSRGRSDSASSRSSFSSDCSSGERSRSRRRIRKPRRSSSKSRSRSRSRSKEITEAKRQKLERKKQQIKERRIVYVGRIPRECSKKDLRRLFGGYGEIEAVNVHKREHGDHFGFVTFMYQCDAYTLIDSYRRDPQLKQYDICFGGRRQFCTENYADLDAKKELEEELNPLGGARGNVDFEDLLKQTKRLIKNQD